MLRCCLVQASQDNSLPEGPTIDDYEVVQDEEQENEQVVSDPDDDAGGDEEEEGEELLGEDMLQ
jgi:hypothetical protein